MLFGTSIHQSISYQASSHQPVPGMVQLLGVHVDSLNASDARGLGGNMRGDVSGNVVGCRGLGDLTSGASSAIASAMNLTAGITTDLTEPRMHDRRVERYPSTETYPSTEAREQKSSKSLENTSARYAAAQYGTAQKATANDAVNPAGSITVVDQSTVVAQNSCPVNINKTWHPVPFIHKTNRLTCRWLEPSI